MDVVEDLADEVGICHVCFVDGFDAAAMVQRMRSLLEHPATLFLEGPG